ncbi:glycosyltransferase family 2 protein [uncultured Muribaculum sp.]|uniref:glycosyltransferase family 2 protein n=1 Tax=uncultured Muribaculum sp. TaxID=1918613 RepID=UPI0025AEC1B7|nr:glycosyltransferase family 2 protein [uncultured Muribaculum sp.]
MSTSRVSILIPCYNGEKYIDRAFESILSQTEKGIQVIFTDDGSTDNSILTAESYIQRFKEKGFQLIILKKDNGGAASAIKLCLTKVSNKYVFPFDVDDLLLPDACELMADFLDNNPDCNLILANGFSVTENARTIIRKDDLPQKCSIFNGLLDGTVCNIPGMYMVRSFPIKEYYFNHTFIESRFGQNLQLLLPAAYNSTAGYISKPVLLYTVHQGSHSNPGNYEGKMKNMDGYRQIRLDMLNDMKLLSDENKRLVEMAYYSAALIVDAQYGRCEEYNMHYNELRKFRAPLFRERMEYSIINELPSQYLYRFIFRIQSLISRR